MANPGSVVASGSGGAPPPVPPPPIAVPTHIDTVQMNTYFSYVIMIRDPNAQDANKLKALAELNENLELITQSPNYASFLAHIVRIFLNILTDGQPLFISEHSTQRVRKQILGILHRLPTNDCLSTYVGPILSTMVTLLREDNEENVLICLRIIIDLHKHYKPPFYHAVPQMLGYMEIIFTDLPGHVPRIFEPRPELRFNNIADVNLEALLAETYTVTTVVTVTRSADGQESRQTLHLVPRGILSLKVLQELPLILVMMYKYHQQLLHRQVINFVPLLMNTITLQPSPLHRNMPTFDREIFADFIGAQINTLSAVSYLERSFQDIIGGHSTVLVQGILMLLQTCPKEVAHQRKDLLIAIKLILASNLRNEFVTSIPMLFDEDLLLGTGWTTRNMLRPFALSMLADLLHHVRQQLNRDVLTQAVHLFGKHVHNESLPIGIQIMSCKLLLNLVECILQPDEVEANSTRDLLITILRIFTLKFHTIAKLHLPQIIQKSQPEDGVAASVGLQQQRGILGFEMSTGEPNSKPRKIGLPPPKRYNLSEYRTLVKSLVFGVQTIAWGCAKRPRAQAGDNADAAKMFHPREILIFIDMVHWALESMEIFKINVQAGSKEDKEVLTHFGKVFVMMNRQNFQEIFSCTIGYIVECMLKNTALLLIVKLFLAHAFTAPMFAAVLVEHLLGRMDEMATNPMRSELYLHLFKNVFGSVSMFAAENERMLRPHLHNIVNRSMQLAKTAKDPYQYFLVLRALFRSIGGGTHDLLYVEFVPLLPSLFDDLNRLHSGLHKTLMKEILVELCLTVPVRLSTLLPYLPLLVDPLVSALNGPPALISQGLRMLELCIENLQPSFICDHIQPVRAALMQALWRTLSNTDDTAKVAFRLLGKLGGLNRPMMIEPQRLDYKDRDSSPAPAMRIRFNEATIDFPMERVIETAFTTLKSKTAEPFNWHQSWEVIRCYLAGSLYLNDDKQTLQQMLLHPSYVDGPIAQTGGTAPYKCADTLARQTHQTALTAMFVAALNKDLRLTVMPTMVAVVRHYTMVAIAQQAGPLPAKRPRKSGLDPLVLIDALATTMGNEEKDLCKPGNLSMLLMLDTATKIMGNKERACQLPIMQYLAERMVALCYKRAWYAKMGGCAALKFLYQHMALRWVYQHLFVFLKAFMYVLMDVAGEVSNGTIDMARTCMDNMLRIGMAPLAPGGSSNDDLTATHQQAMADVVRELVRQVTSSTELVREQAMSALRLIAELQGKTVTAVMEPHREVLVDIVPPKKHLLRHQPADTQIGLMDGNTFCTTLKPRLFTIDLIIQSHHQFFLSVLELCTAEDDVLHSMDCYKNVKNLVPLRISAMRALAACHYIADKLRRTQIAEVLLSSLKKCPAIQTAAFECLQTFQAGRAIKSATIKSAIRPLLLTLGDYRNFTVHGVRRLSYLTQLFPSMFVEKLCDQMLLLISKMLEHWLATKADDTEQKITAMMGIFHQVPVASAKFVGGLCKLTLTTERQLMIVSCPFREPLVKFLLRYPHETMDLLLGDACIKDEQWNRFMIYLLRHKDGLLFRQSMEYRTGRLSLLILSLSDVQPAEPPATGGADRYEVQQQAVLVVHTLHEFDDQFLSRHSEAVTALRSIWLTDLDRSYERNVTCDLWHRVAQLLLHYFTHHTDDIALLFVLVKALCGLCIPDFLFLREFLQNTVAANYTFEWKRSAFFRFVDRFNAGALSQDQTAMILTTILIPCFAVGFERGEGVQLVGVTPRVSNAVDRNVVSVFIGRVIDSEQPLAHTDGVRIAMLQFASLLVERASMHIYEGDTNIRQPDGMLRRLMTYAWPCMLGTMCVDPSVRYYGHLLLAHIIAKLPISKSIVLHVFYKLLQADALEARPVVQQALDVLTPALQLRMDDGNAMVSHWTKKVLVEQGSSMHQLCHIMKLVVRHSRVYYPVRQQLMQHLLSALNRLAFSATTTHDNRRLAVDVAEVIVKWEVQRLTGDPESLDGSELDDGKADDAASQYSVLFGGSAVKRPAADVQGPRKRANTSLTILALPEVAADLPINRPIDKAHCDAVLTCLMRLACQLNEATRKPNTVQPGENLSRRCVNLIKMAMLPKVWSPPSDPRMIFMEKLFVSLEAPPTPPDEPNVSNICTGLGLLTFLLGVMTNDQILATIGPLQSGLSACVSFTQIRVTRVLHGLLPRLMGIFPADQNAHDELVLLYSNVSQMIDAGLTAYESNAQAMPETLSRPMMILKAACMKTASYIDFHLVLFMRVLSRLKQEHTSKTQAAGNVGEVAAKRMQVTVELLILSLELVKNRIGVMSVATRTQFIENIVIDLALNTTDVKLMKAIISLVDEWMRQNPNPLSYRERVQLLEQLQQCVLTRFGTAVELNVQFLELINYICRDEQLQQEHWTDNLQPALFTGLRWNEPTIRAKFVEIFDGSISPSLYARLLYFVTTKGWDSIGLHYWIKQFIELLLRAANSSTPLQNANDTHRLPSISSVIGMADDKAAENFLINSSRQQEVAASGEIPAAEDTDEDAFDMDMTADPNISRREDSERPVANRQAVLTKMIARQIEFLEAHRDLRSEQLLAATIELCHMDTQLAERVWLDVFPRLWSILSGAQQRQLRCEIVQFLSSGKHVAPNVSAMNTFVQALTQCQPPVFLPPELLTYLGKAHNLWHPMTLALEELAHQLQMHRLPQPQPQLDDPDIADYTGYAAADNDDTMFAVYNPLSQMYEALHEEDRWAALWQKCATYTDTSVAIAYEQMGAFDEAQTAYERAMGKYVADATQSQRIRTEMSLWEQHWFRCTKQLNQWNILLDNANKFAENKSMLIMESAWHVPDLPKMMEALTTGERSQYKVNLFRGFVAVLNTERQQLTAVDRYADTAAELALRDWRRLPAIVSHVHQPLLQAAQQIIELHEAGQIHQSLRAAGNVSLHDIADIVRTWRNRMPVVADDLSHWSDIITFRQHHYQAISEHLERQPPDSIGTHALLGKHASARALIDFGRMARKHNSNNVCQDTLSRVYTMPAVPVDDCFQTIRQMSKCFLQMYSTSGGGGGGGDELAQALDVIESANLNYFTPEMGAELLAMKGQLQTLSGLSAEGKIAFDSAIEMHSTLIQAWSRFGDYLEHFLTTVLEPNDPRAMAVGISAMMCFLRACQHQNKFKSRKYLAKVLWLLSFDDDQKQLMAALGTYGANVSPLHWLPWIPQLLCCLVHSDSDVIVNLLTQVGRMFPQAVYFPIRTLYLTLKIEEREKQKIAEREKQASQRDASTASTSTQPQPPQHQAPIKATQPMWRCSKVMHMQREIHPTILTALEGIVDQLVWFRENWYEEVLRLLRQGLIKCYTLSFENRHAVREATITQYMRNFIKKLVSTFGVDVGVDATAAAARPGQAPVFAQVAPQMRANFRADFDFAPSADLPPLRTLIGKLKKWIRMLEVQTRQLPRSFLIEDRCRYLANFSQTTGDVELPGELLLPRLAHTHIHIARFMPRVQIVEKHNTSARRLCILGTNGKIYPYLVVNDTGLSDARREEHVLQLLRMLNHSLAKRKETSRRFLNITVPAVVAVSPQMRLVEDNPASLSLLDVFRAASARRGVDHDRLIERYYDRLAAVQARGAETTQAVLRDILHDVQSSMVPRTLLKDWATRLFQSATDYWQFRNMFTLQLALTAVCEHALHLTRVNAEMMYLHQDSGLVSVSYVMFDLNDQTGELNDSRPVPFRLTPNIVEFVSANGIAGPLSAAAVATAVCLRQPNVKLTSFLQAILRDDIVAVQLKSKIADNPCVDANGVINNAQIVLLVNKAVAAIEQRLNAIVTTETCVTNEMTALVQAAQNPDNLCRMDPAWHPWL